VSDSADPADLAFASVAALSAQLRGREVSPVALAEACLARADALAPDLGCFASVLHERTLAEARAAEGELADGRWRGPLHAIPFALADVVDTRGVPTALGLSALAARTPERDATVAARIADHGPILLGKTAVAPLGGALPANPSPGPTAAAAAGGAGELRCRSPWDRARALAGPSPGAPAAVAAGLVPFALGAHAAAGDLAAAACGVTSLRPTYGALSRRGATLASYGLATLGIVARTAEDVALVLDALAGVDPRDPASVAAPAALARVQPRVAQGLRVGALDVPPAVGDLSGHLGAAQETLRDGGAIVSAAGLPDLPWVELAALLESAEAEVIASAAPDAPAPTAGGPTAADYVRAARLRTEAQRALGRLFEKADLVLAPAPAEGDGHDPLSAAIALGGLPVLTFPVGLADGRPTAARLVAPPLEEARLLSAAALFQARTPHHRERPRPAGAAVTRR
jgi:aspartyl-tRNA(Asn)/glutamyl-tRNA(Gln) amidotransferase subunit A